MKRRIIIAAIVVLVVGTLIIAGLHLAGPAVEAMRRLHGM
jgi:hypothetical protein